MSKSKQNKFLNLYKPIHERFERFCRARSYGDMPFEDLINETLLVAYKKMDKLKNEEAFLGFLIGISTKLLANSGRKKRAETVDNELFLSNYIDPQGGLEQQFEIELLYRSLAQIPKEQREALILFEITGFSIKEIASLHNAGESAIKQRLARGRKALEEVVRNELAYKKEVSNGK
jgi:RNA polymerase sigma-70 factor (ECF subfamily)